MICDVRVGSKVLERPAKRWFKLPRGEHAHGCRWAATCFLRDLTTRGGSPMSVALARAPSEIALRGGCPDTPLPRGAFGVGNRSAEIHGETNDKSGLNGGIRYPRIPDHRGLPRGRGRQLRAGRTTEADSPVSENDGRAGAEGGPSDEPGIERRAKRDGGTAMASFLSTSRSGLIQVEIYSKGYTESSRMAGSWEGLCLSGVSRI